MTAQERQIDTALSALRITIRDLIRKGIPAGAAYEAARRIIEEAGQ